MNIKQILEKLPGNWDEVTLELFTKLIDCKVDTDDDILDGYNNVINFASAITGIPTEDFDNIKMIDINQIGSKLSFINTDIPQVKSNKFKWKKLDEILMDDYITFIQYGDKQIYHLLEFVKAFNKVELTDEEIQQLPITEVMWGFFLFRKNLRKSLKASITSERMIIAKYKVKEIAKKLMNKVISKENRM